MQNKIFLFLFLFYSQAHVTLKGTSMVKADLMFVNVASQKVQGYGCVHYSVSDAQHKKHQLLLSPEGVVFVYEEKTDRAYTSDNKELIAWDNVVDVTCETTYVIIHLGGGATERRLKIKGKNVLKRVRRIREDLSRLVV